MSFKTKEEMFGDGAGFGAAVPFSTTNPPGTGAGNRGIQFGEQLTAAIANRPHYALALNDEDLNARVASFESGGLDGGYDNGLVGPAGAGRQITKDAGAVETVSTTGSQYADDIANAHFRVDATGDTSPGGGFDYVGKEGGILPVYGYLARFNIAINAVSVIDLSEAVTLNPGGAGGDIMRITAGTAYAGSDTSLQLDGTDFFEISGVGTGVNGLYFVHSLGPSATDFRLRRMDGTTPSFSSGASATAKLYRALLMAPAKVPSGASYGAIVSGRPGTISALSVMTGDINGYAGTGPAKALLFQPRRSTGVVFNPTHFTGGGQYVSTLSAADFASADRDTEMRVNGGITSMVVDRSGSTGSAHEAGLSFRDMSDAAKAWAALEVWQRIVETSILGIGATVNGTFASPSGRVILPDSDGTPAAPTGQLKWFWPLVIFPGYTLIKVLSGSLTGNYYLISKVTLTGSSAVDTVPDEMTLVDLDGGSAGLPTSGNFTFSFVSRSSVLAKPPIGVVLDDGPTNPSPGDLVGYANLFTSPATTGLDEPRAVGIVGHMACVRAGVTDAAVAGDYGLKETWVLTSSGDIFLNGDAEVGGVITMGEGHIITCEQSDITINHHILNGSPEHDSGGNAQWWWDQTNGYWISLSSSAVIYFPISWTGRFMTTTIQVFGPSGAHSVTGSLQIVTPVWGTPASAPTFNNSNPTTASVNNSWAEISISHGLGSGTNVTLASNSYAIRVAAGATGDRIRAMRHSIRFTSIGPGGIGG